MKKIIFVALVVVILAIPLSSCTTKDSTELVVGMELAYPPFETKDANDNPDGISVKMAYALGEYLGRTVRIEDMEWSGLIPALTTGKVDIVISSMTITEERQKTVNFSDPYAKSQLSLLVNKESSVQEFNDLKADGRLLAVKKGTTGHTYALEHLPESNIVVFETETSCVLEVAQGRADAFIYDAMTIYKNAQIHTDTTKAVLTPFQEDYEYWGAALNKESTQLLEDVNKFIKEFQGNGGMDELAEQYLGEIKKVFDDQGLSFFFDID
ncbi:MAG: transporter substrate-binding domain-containing protein [Clostridia bacterium]|nr:transporter substrate-binding domain-containing protein [Clostridia bacterium]